jgi:hypothetical protein
VDQRHPGEQQRDAAKAPTRGHVAQRPAPRLGVRDLVWHLAEDEGVSLKDLVRAVQQLARETVDSV